MIYSCKTENKNNFNPAEIKTTKVVEKKEAVEIKTESAKIDQKKENLRDSLNLQTEFNIDFIKSKTTEVSNEISVSYNHSSQNKKTIPNEFLKKYIRTHKIDIGFPEYLPADYPESYSLKEFKEYEQFDLFTFTYDDESCCTTLYAVTTKKDTIDIINIGVIGYTGGDGGWIGEKYGKWTNEYLISNIEASEYEEPAPKEPVEKEIDTVWSEIKILKNGIMEYSEIKKVKYLGNKKVE